MPPRIPQLPRLGQATLCFRTTAQSSSTPFLPATATANVSSKAGNKKHRDQYAIAQAKQRKAANLQRQAELQALRKKALGDPIKGNVTPFVESFDTATPVPGEKPIEYGAPGFNYYLKPEEVSKSIDRSFLLTQPTITNSPLADPMLEEKMVKQHAEGHERAVEAVKRIVQLDFGNRSDKMRINVQRCIANFGRHHTDEVLPPRPAAVTPEGTKLAEKTPRAGPDTGSPEVQIAVLTAKIRNLSNHLAGEGKGDKVNRRNLRLLVHKRQKQLAYLRKKERGGPRWQNVIEQLGLTEATWKGEITV